MVGRRKLPCCIQNIGLETGTVVGRPQPGRNFEIHRDTQLRGWEEREDVDGHGSHVRAGMGLIWGSHAQPEELMTDLR